MAEEHDDENVSDPQSHAGSEGGAEPSAPEPPTPSRPGNLRVAGIAIVASLATALVTAGSLSLVHSSGEQSRAAAAQAEFDAQLAAAEQRTADMASQLEALHRRQALYVAHTSVIRATQELDKSNFGSASELLKHAGQALNAADPRVAAEIQQTIQGTMIEVGEDRIAQQSRLREIAKSLQDAMGG